jgi:hypothetical protein
MRRPEGISVPVKMFQSWMSSFFIFLGARNSGLTSATIQE